uniref:hypothetical protein n=1 Tax=Streptomyces hirsutus TaxID=35620 RepID=UPI002DD849C2|nr:hypothetical protein [Streptomyces hirsutus]
MDATTTATRAKVLRAHYHSRLPERLQELGGPVEGTPSTCPCTSSGPGGRSTVSPARSPA